jgi:predicted outer membrane protein
MEKRRCLRYFPGGMNRLTPFRGTLFRLAVINVLLIGVAAAAFLQVERARADRGFGSAPAAWQQHEPPREVPRLLSEADRRFVTQAAEMTWQAIRLAEVGVQKASGSHVRRYAAALVDAQSAARNEIETLAAQRGMALPTGTRPLRSADEVAAETGREFDASFVHWAGDLHRRAAQLFEEAARHSDDAALREFAARVVPRLKQDQRRAHELALEVASER